MGELSSSDRIYMEELRTSAKFYQGIVFHLIRRIGEFRDAERIILDEILSPVSGGGGKGDGSSFVGSQKKLPLRP